MYYLKSAILVPLDHQCHPAYTVRPCKAYTHMAYCRSGTLQKYEPTKKRNENVDAQDNKRDCSAVLTHSVYLLKH